MYLLDEFKDHPDYIDLLYKEAISAGACCTIARALLANIEAYMGEHAGQPDRIHPSVRITMNNLREWFTMRDDWLNRLRDMRLADHAPLPFDEQIGASVPIATKKRASRAAAVVAERATGEGDAEISRILDRAKEAIGRLPDPPTEKRKRPAKASV